MSYTKQTWHTGDDIIDSKLNHIEQGVADAECDMFMVNVTVQNDSATVDKTFAEVMAKINDGHIPIYSFLFTDDNIKKFYLIKDYTDTEIVIDYPDSTSRYVHDSTGVRIVITAGEQH